MTTTRITTETIAGLRLDHAIPAESTGAAPMLYVHGCWGGAWVFEHSLRQTVAEGREAWAINLRGHHGSRPVSDLAEVGIEDYVRDVQDALDVIGPAAVVGHSMGGLVAQVVASRDDVTAAVLLASLPPPAISLLTWSLAVRIPRYAVALFGSRALRVRDADARRLALNAVPPALAQVVTARFVEDSVRVAWQLALGRVPQPRPIRCPTLVVGGRHDRLTPARLQRRIAARYGADYLETAHGHMLPVEPPWRATLARVLAWLDAVESRHAPALPGGQASCASS